MRGDGREGGGGGVWRWVRASDNNNNNNFLFKQKQKQTQWRCVNGITRLGLMGTGLGDGGGQGVSVRGGADQPAQVAVAQFDVVDEGTG